MQMTEASNGFKETEIGPIPVEWEVVRLGELMRSQRLMAQNGFPCGEHNQQGRGIPHLRPFNVTIQGEIDLETLKYIETHRNVTPYLLKPGDIIFNNTNSEELVGKTAYWDHTGDFVLSNHMTILRVLTWKSCSSAPTTRSTSSSCVPIRFEPPNASCGAWRRARPTPV